MSAAPDKHRSVYHRFDSLVLRGEGRTGRALFSVLVAFVLMIAGAVYVRPAVEPVVHGINYALLSRNPFDFAQGNQMGFRLLTPVISYLIGLRGDLIIVTNLLMATAFLAMALAYFRRNAPRPADALLAATTFAFSLVTLTTIYYGGYCDSLTYLLIFLAWWFRANRPVFYLLILLGMTNHESVAFLIPWFIFISYQVYPRKLYWLLDTVIGFTVTLGLYFLYRELITREQQIRFSITYYFRPMAQNPWYWFYRSSGYKLLGFFTVFKLYWLFVIVAVTSMCKCRQWRQLVSIALILACAWAQMFFAFDSSRMLTLSFPVMVISLLHLLRHNPYRFRSWAGVVVIANFFVPQLYVGGKIVDKMHSLIGSILAMQLSGRIGW
ncbi:MAG: hypothetical protein JSW34_09265 [Candidatus Zixiibacteriota bacterium]|nr:MAG: hypothetical protein JSW34_09265 [candidate division Zixibacteria bacterium]